jgi:uncharacterized protein YfaS (alpha-2-macroglobulin family)
VEAGIKRVAASITSDGYLPYWPGGEGNAFSTIAGYWALKNAEAQRMAVPGRTVESLENAVRLISLGDKQAPGDSFARAYAAMVLAESAKANERASLASVLHERFLRREEMDDECRALLAITMHRLNILPQEKVQLLREIDRPGKERALDPESFASTCRTEAIRALAFATVDPAGREWKTMANLRKQIAEWLDSSQSLSTQENFWLLLAYKALHSQPLAGRVDFRRAAPAPVAISRNGASATWTGIDPRRLQEFALRLDHASPLICLVEAQYRSESEATDRSDRGFRLERVVKNLTEEHRLGTSKAPFQLGDQILVTYRLVSPKLHHYVALEDELPAALETVNPNSASLARTYSIPQEKGSKQLNLSFSELRDRVTCLYFDRVEPGIASYSVLARATSAGVFRWPGTKVTPMYDSRFSGVSPSSLCYVSGE